MSAGVDTGTTNGTAREEPTDRGRALGLGVGVGGFVAVHLLALLAVDEPSLPALVAVETVALVALVAGDAAATGTGPRGTPSAVSGLRRTLPVGAGVLAALGAVGVALGPAGVEPWVATAAAFAVAGSLLYAGHRYDRYLAGGGGA